MKVQNFLEHTTTSPQHHQRQHINLFKNENLPPLSQNRWKLQISAAHRAAEGLEFQIAPLLVCFVNGKFYFATSRRLGILLFDLVNC